MVIPSDKSSVDYKTSVESEVEELFVPRTEFGRKLLDLRNGAIRNGMRLLTIDQIFAEKE